MTEHFDIRQDVYEDDDGKWYRCLYACGMDFPFQAAIMDFPFKELRLTESCLFWVKDTIEMRLASIVSQNQHTRATPQQQQQTMPGLSSESWTPFLTRGSDDGPMILYKAVDQARAASPLNDRGEVQRLEKLSSKAPTELSGDSSRFYFHEDYQVAEYHAAYMKRRAACEAVAMVRITIPGQIFEDLHESGDLEELCWPEPEWKEYIWRSKLDKSLPELLQKYRDALIAAAHIAKGSARLFEMETWEDVPESCFFSAGRSMLHPSVHYSFSGRDESREFLEEHGKFEAFDFSDADVQRVRAREAKRALWRLEE